MISFSKFKVSFYSFLGILFILVYVSCSPTKLEDGGEQIGVVASPRSFSFVGIEGNAEAYFKLTNYEDTLVVIKSISISDPGYSLTNIQAGDTLQKFAFVTASLKLNYSFFNGSDTANVVLRIDGSQNTDSVLIQVRGPRKAVAKNLSRNNFQERAVDISPDNSRILFVSNRGGTQKAYTMNFEGNDVQPLASSLTSLQDAVRYTHDGQQILFYSIIDETKTIIYLHDIATKVNQVILQNDGYNIPVDISSDGLKILYNKKVGTNHNVHVIDIDGSNKVALANDSNVDQLGVFFEPRDQRVLYHAFEDFKNQMYKVRVTGEDTRKVSDGTSIDIPVATTADGSYIVFYTDRQNRREVMMSNWDGGDLIKTTDNLQYDYPADINGTTRTVLFTTSINGNPEVFESGYRGDRLLRLTTNIAEDRAIKYSRDARFILAQRFEPNSQVYLIDIRSYR